MASRRKRFVTPSKHEEDVSRLSAKASERSPAPIVTNAPYGFQVQGALSVDASKIQEVSDHLVIDSPGKIKLDSHTLDMSNEGAATFNAGVTIPTTTGALLLPRLTTTQRNALTAANGMIIYNTTDSKFQGYAGGAWVNLH